MRLATNSIDWKKFCSARTLYSYSSWTFAANEFEKERRKSNRFEMYISFTSFLAQHICFLSRSLHAPFPICFAPFQFIFSFVLSLLSLTKNECVFYSFQRFRSIQCYDTRAFYVLFQLFPRATLNVQFFIISVCICICICIRVHVCTHTQRFHVLTFLCIISKAHTVNEDEKKAEKRLSTGVRVGSRNSKKKSEQITYSMHVL